MRLGFGARRVGARVASLGPGGRGVAGGAQRAGSNERGQPGRALAQVGPAGHGQVLHGERGGRVGRDPRAILGQEQCHREGVDAGVVPDEKHGRDPVVHVAQPVEQGLRLGQVEAVLDEDGHTRGKRVGDALDGLPGAQCRRAQDEVRRQPALREMARDEGARPPTGSGQGPLDVGGFAVSPVRLRVPQQQELVRAHYRAQPQAACAPYTAVSPPFPACADYAEPDPTGVCPYRPARAGDHQSARAVPVVACAAGRWQPLTWLACPKRAAPVNGSERRVWALGVAIEALRRRRARSVSGPGPGCLIVRVPGS
ncbi:hypothetical protein FAIPA1_130113 [Frankia sp. AiPs1]